MTDGVVPLPLAGEIVGTDVAELARDFPECEVGSAWVAAASGTDYRYLWARTADGVIVAAPNKPSLAEHLRALP